MKRGFWRSRRIALLGGGAAALGLGGWLGREIGSGATEDWAEPRPVRVLRWPDLRPASQREAAASLSAGVEALRRRDLGLPEARRAPTVPAQEQTGFRSHQSVVAGDWVDAAAFDTSPAADAPFDWNSGRAPRLEELVAELHGQRVSLAGYAAPLDGDLGAVRSFLLAPYVGACIHVPPPPPNQIVLVSSEAPQRFEALFEPITVIGEMRVTPVRSSLAEVGYQLRAEKIGRYDPSRPPG